MSYQEAQINNAYLRVVFSGTVVPIGITANIIAIYIFRQKALNSKDTKHGEMNALLCFFNSLSLSSSFLITQFLPYFGVNLIRISNASCIIFSLWLRFTLQVPSLHQCLATLLFYLSIRYPTRTKFMYEKGFIIKCMLGMFAFMFVANVMYFWYYLQFNYKTTSYFDSVSNTTRNVTVETSRACRADFLPSIAGDFINILLRVFIPFFILLLLNVLILRRVSKAKRNISDPRSLHGSVTKHSANDARFGRVLIFLNFLFLFMYLPWALSFIISYALTSQGVRLTTLIEGSNDEELMYLYNVSYSLSFAYNASPFFVNLIFNKLFQREFLRIFVPFIQSKETSAQSASPDGKTLNTMVKTK